MENKKQPNRAKNKYLLIMALFAIAFAMGYSLFRRHIPAPTFEAELDDGTKILIEMHLYDVEELKYKTVRSWAHKYSEGLRQGEDYSVQAPVVCVSFTNEAIDKSEVDKVHKCCKIADIESGHILTDALELHYINMQAFIEAINKATKPNMTMLESWLAILTETEKDIADKAIIRDICEKEEDMNMAISTLVRISEDEPTQYEYWRWREEMARRERERVQLENERREAAKNVRKIAEQGKVLAEQGKVLVEQEKTIDDMAKVIDELRSRLDEN
ncbi:MAG: Rpn family recombination-promoting nuclease/putative transposase [Turicibacter sp.]|nr:Rpn family recombination-promoting nuclease/putative transposase [Turicibacter sp.]